MKKIILIIIILITIFTPTANAEETNTTDVDTDAILESQSETLGISSFIEEADKYKSDEFDIDVGELITGAIKGEIDNQTIGQQILNLLFSQVGEAIKSIGIILVIVVISSILKSISDDLENKSIAQISHYVTYILIVTIIMKNFSDIIVMIRTSIENLVGFSNSLIPLLITLMLTTGNIASASMLQPIILFIITFIGNFINTILIPASLVAVALNVIGHLAISIGKYSNEEIMGKEIITDKSGIEHLGISRFPFIITKVKVGKLKNAIDTAKNNPNLLVADYPRDMLDTRTDDELVESINSKENEKLEYLGAVIYGDTREVDEITGKFQLWRID